MKNSAQKLLDQTEADKLKQLWYDIEHEGKPCDLVYIASMLKDKFKVGQGPVVSRNSVLSSLYCVIQELESDE